MCVCCIASLVTTQAYYLIAPILEGMWSAWLGSFAASFSAAVAVCASGSATHQSWSPSRPTADQAPHSTNHTHTHIQKTDKTVMSLCLMGHNSRTGLAAHCGL